MSHSLKKWSSNFETTNAEKLHRLFSLHYDASEKARLLARPPHVCHMSGSFNMHHVLQVNVSRGLVYVSLSKPTCRDELARCACKCITCKSTKKNPKTRNIGIKIRESMWICRNGASNRHKKAQLALLIVFLIWRRQVVWRNEACACHTLSRNMFDPNSALLQYVSRFLLEHSWASSRKTNLTGPTAAKNIQKIPQWLHHSSST